jgi:hypothetical protein
MSPRHARRGRARPAFEPLEARGLLSVTPMLAGARRVAVSLAPPGPSSPAAAATPTPLYAARSTFFAAYRGPYYVGPPRMTDQSGQIYLRGGGTSNMFLHGNLQLALYPPADPNAPTTGAAALIGKSVENTGDLLGLDLSGPVSRPTPGVPFVLGWTVNVNSGGTFSDATGSGTVEIRLRPGAGTREGAGVAEVIFRGNVYATGLYNITRV